MENNLAAGNRSPLPDSAQCVKGGGVRKMFFSEKTKGLFWSIGSSYWMFNLEVHVSVTGNKIMAKKQPFLAIFCNIWPLTGLAAKIGLHQPILTHCESATVHIVIFVPTCFLVSWHLDMFACHSLYCPNNLLTPTFSTAKSQYEHDRPRQPGQRRIWLPILTIGRSHWTGC